MSALAVLPHLIDASHRFSLEPQSKRHGTVTRGKPEIYHPTPIYFARPSEQYRAHHGEIDAAIQRVLDGHVFILGDEVRQFETEFADFTGARHAIGVANGTDALHLSLRALDIGIGDEVITTAHTAVATVAAVELAGATPVFADIEPAYYGLAVAAVEQMITHRTKAIIPVHLYGHPVDLDAFSALAERYGVALIEDCAQAHGARWNGRQVGRYGITGCFSCYPTKNLGALGDAGIIITDDDSIAEDLRALRQYGWKDGQISRRSGMNSRLDEVQAAILRVKLRYLAEDNQRRRAIAARYQSGLSGLPLTLPRQAREAEPVYHLYVIQSAARDAIKAALATREIIAGIHYPMPVHRQPAYQERFAACRLPNAETAAANVLSLPIYPELSDDQIDRVVDAMHQCFQLVAAE